MNNRNETNKKGEYRIDEMFSEIFETETINMEDGSELLQEGLTRGEKQRILGIAMEKIEGRLQAESKTADTEKDRNTPERTAVFKLNSRRRILIVSLAAILTFATTAFAAEIFQWDTRLSNYFEIGSHNQQDLSGSGMNVGISAEYEGVAIEAVQTIGDGNNIYILLNVTAPEGQIIHPGSSFDMIYVRVDGVTGMGYSCDMMADDDENDNKATFLLAMEANNKINNKKINIRFSNLRHYITGSGEMVVDTEGEWELEWKLDYEDISKTYQIGEALTIKGESVKVESISISPIALNVKVQGAYFEKYDEAPGAPGEGDPIAITAIKLKGGSVLTWEDASSWGCSIRGRECSLNMQMKKLLDVSQVESITLNDKEFVLSAVD